MGFKWVPLWHCSPVYPSEQLHVYGRLLEGAAVQVPWDPHGLLLQRAKISFVNCLSIPGKGTFQESNIKLISSNAISKILIYH